jgi:23S rRNA (uracil-5-)-methyltransferase RumA
MTQIWIKKWDILENILIEKLVFGGKWFARLKHTNPDYDGRVIFVTWWAIPGSVADLRVLKKKKAFIETQIFKIIKKSPLEKINKENKYGMSGWWKWINIGYNEQLKIKEEQVEEAFNILKAKQDNISFKSIIPSPTINWYRNKVEFSYWKYISHKFDIAEHFNVWFHKQWEFSKVEDFDWCPLIDEIQNEIYREIKNFSKTLWLPVYDQMRQEWFFRHILIRKTFFTNEMMLLLSFNDKYFDNNLNLDKNEKLWLLKDFFINLSKKYNIIKSIYFSYNPNKADVCIWDLELIYWNKVISEELLNLKFEISPTSFFQTNSSGAEQLYQKVLDFVINKEIKNQVVLDLYWGTWTIGMIFANAWAKDVISVELVKSSSKDGEKNAKYNKLNNISFVNSKVEDFLWKYINAWKYADLLIIDPPRVWMHPDALPNILKFKTHQIIYISCNPATLVRDLWYILDNSNYKIEKIQAMDMFPHTNHIETIVSLVLTK